MQNEPRFSLSVTARLLMLEVPLLKAILRATGLSHHYALDGNIGKETLRALRQRFYDAS